jgi:hypothetical protein
MGQVNSGGRGVGYDCGAGRDSAMKYWPLPTLRKIFIKWAFRAARSFLISSILFLITSLKSHHISRDIVITWWQAADDRTPTFHPKNRHDAAR